MLVEREWRGRLVQDHSSPRRERGMQQQQQQAGVRRLALALAGSPISCG